MTEVADRHGIGPGAATLGAAAMTTPVTLPAWHDARGWADLLAATPSAEDRVALLRERCRAIGAVPARFDDGTEYLRLDLPVPGLTVHFVPASGRPSWGKTDAAGRFVLDYDPQNKGAEVGVHKVWVEFRPSSPEEEDLWANYLARLPKDRKELLEKYGSPAASPYEVQISKDTRQVEVKLD